MRKKLQMVILLLTILVFGSCVTARADTTAASPGRVVVSAQRSNLKAKEFTMYWHSVQDADGYELYVYDLNKKELSVKRVSASKSSATLEGISSGTFYRMKLRAYQNVQNPITGVKKIAYGSYTTIYFAQQPKVKFAWRSKTTTTATWTEVSGATGYVVYLSDTNGQSFQKVAQVKTPTAVLRKLKVGKKYAVRVVAVRKDKNGTYQTPRTYTYSFRMKLKE